MPADRSLVRLEAAERVDLPDFEAMQRNDRSASRMMLDTLVFGGNPTYKNASLGGWIFTDSGLELTCTAGISITGEKLADGTVESGVPTGSDGDASQVLDFTGEADASYAVYLRSDFSAGELGARAFWDAGTSAETIDTINTRYKAGWKVIYQLLAAAHPGDEYHLIALVVKVGSVLVVTDSAFRLFEGTIAGGAHAAYLWGDGVNDRNADRHLYGITNLTDWLGASRRQLADIIGAKWYTAIPVTAVEAPGAAVDLTYCRDHVDKVTDPHSASPTWTGTVTAEDVVVNDDLTVADVATFNGASTFNGVLTCTTTSEFQDEAEFQDNIVLTGSGLNNLPKFDTDIASGRDTYRIVSPNSWTLDAPTTSGDVVHNYSLMKVDSAAGSAYGYWSISLNEQFDGHGLATDGFLLETIDLTLAKPSGYDGTITDAFSWYFSRRAIGGSSFTTLASGTFTGAALSTSPTQESLDISGVGASSRTLSYAYEYALRIVLKHDAGNVLDSAAAYGMTLGGKAKYIAP